MESVYSDLKNPAGLASVQKLYRELRNDDDTVTKKDVEKNI